MGHAKLNARATFLSLKFRKSMLALDFDGDETSRFLFGLNSRCPACLGQNRFILDLQPQFDSQNPT
jgi:hypothetical protein